MLHRTSRALEPQLPMSEDPEHKLRHGPRLDPAGAAFWDARYREALMPWDAGGVPAAVRRFLEGERGRLRVLIPGCGAAYEARAFAERGHEVLAIDFSPLALDRARAFLGDWSSVLRFADFFADALGAPFDLVYERAFLCSLPPAYWQRWATRVAEVMRPGGRLVGFFFARDEARGPPFGLKAGELERLLAAAFDRIEDASVDDSIPVFAGGERWQVWYRR
jgi:SAM-dependent methyltransferase